MTVLQPLYMRVSLTVTYDSVLFPFDAGSLLRSLARQGFLVPESLLKAILAAPHVARLEPSGAVARKGEVVIGMNAERKTMSVHASGPQSVLSEMESLESLLKDEFGVDSSSIAQFYEFTASLSIKAGKNPLESWGAQLGQSPMIQEVSEVIGIDVSLFGLRLVGKGQVPMQTDWFDIRIEPLVHSPTTHHYVEIVFRNSGRDTVFGFVRELERTLEGLISMLERE